MTRERIGQLAFAGAVALALSLYGFTAPDGLPWNGSTVLAEAYLNGRVVPGLSVANAIWGFYVKVFGGAVALSITMAAISAGILAVLVNRYFGWRFAAGVALVWIFLPGVWDRAITGERSLGLAALVVATVWVINAMGLWVTRKVRSRTARWSSPVAVGMAGGDNLGAPMAHEVRQKYARINRIAGWVVLGAAGIFVVVSMTIHDYRLGEVASAYARLVVEEAGDRIILMNGVCDEQVERAATGTAFSFRNTEGNRSHIVAWVKREWPGETNLWLAAEIGPETFAEAAVKAHPERFYSMMGQSTTQAQWERRWTAMKPYLKSCDPAVPAIRRMFAYEGNFLANALQEEGNLKAAWNLYYRIFTEIHPKNPAACFNLNAMLRQGYRVDDLTRERVESAQSDYAKLLKDRQRARRAAEWISHFGPVMRDQKAYEEMRARVRKRLEELEKAGAKSAMIPDLKTLQEWHVEMMAAFRERKYEKAARIARAILARKAWCGFIPAHMILGEAMMMKGDWVAAEVFLRKAVEAKGTAAPPPYVLNDYAEVLRQLGRLEEAERYARRAVAESDEKTRWISQLTLAEVLEEKVKRIGEGEGKVKMGEEIANLLKAALRHAPKEAREKIRQEHGVYLQ